MRREGKKGGKEGKCQGRVNTKRLSSQTREEKQEIGEASGEQLLQD